MGLIVQVIASISLMYIALVSVVPFKINNKYLMYTVFISLVAVVPLKLQIEYLGIIVLTFIQIIFVYFHNQNIFTSIFFTLMAVVIMIISDYLLNFLCLMVEDKR